MDLLLVILVTFAMVILAVRRRRRGPPASRMRPGARGWSFSRHPREDWRYWRDLAVLIGLALTLLVVMVILAGIDRP